jgi:hypothetical protein
LTEGLGNTVGLKNTIIIMVGEGILSKIEDMVRGDLLRIIELMVEQIKQTWKPSRSRSG